MALGSPDNLEALQTFIDVGRKTSITFCADPSAAQGCILIPSDGRFRDGDYMASVRATDTFGNVSDVVSAAIEIDATGPQSGQLRSASGPFAIDRTKFTFDWLGFHDPNGISGYEVAFGNPDSRESLQPFFAVDLATSITFCAERSAEEGCTLIPSDDGRFRDGDYMASVRAVDTLGNVSQVVSATVKLDPTAYKIGQILPPPGADDTTGDIDWERTTVSPDTHAIKIQHAQQVLVGDYGRPITVTWHYTSTEDPPSPPITRQYNTSSVPLRDPPMVIYYTHDGHTPTDMPPVDLRGNEVTIHYNEAVPDVKFDPADDKRHVWRDGGKLFARSKMKDPAYVVLEYNTTAEPTSSNDFKGIEIVQVKADEPDVPDREVHVGSRARPNTSLSGTVPVVTRGGEGDPQYIYQHRVPESKQKGQIWAIRPNDDPYNMEVVWMRPGLEGIMWPYELRRYTAVWPKKAPSKYPTVRPWQFAGSGT